MEIRTLDKGETLLSHDPVQVRVQFGRIWMTIEGDENDYILNPGESVLVDHNQTVLLEGIENAQISIR